MGSQLYEHVKHCLPPQAETMRLNMHDNFYF